MIDDGNVKAGVWSPIGGTLEDYTFSRQPLDAEQTTSYIESKFCISTEAVERKFQHVAVYVVLASAQSRCDF